MIEFILVIGLFNKKYLKYYFYILNMGKKDRKPKRQKKEIVYRTKEERQNKVKEILSQLNKFKLNSFPICAAT